MKTKEKTTYDVRTIKLPLPWSLVMPVRHSYKQGYQKYLIVQFNLSDSLQIIKYTNNVNSENYIEISEYSGFGVAWTTISVLNDEELLSYIQEWYWKCCSKYKTE